MEIKRHPDTKLRVAPRWGLSTIKAPSGRFIYVGTVPAELDGLVFESAEDAIARARSNDWHCGQPVKAGAA